MIGFLSLRQLHEWENVNPLLREIIEAVHDGVWPSNAILLILSIYRTIQENNADGARTTIHVTPEGEKHRASDVRTNLISEEAKEKVIAFVEARWQYDPGRPTLMVAYGSPHGTGPHIHFQVHPNTVRRSPHV